MWRSRLPQGYAGGLEERPQIRHVIVDEAQDYSALQFRVLRFWHSTVLGDMNHRARRTGERRLRSRGHRA